MRIRYLVALLRQAPHWALALAAAALLGFTALVFWPAETQQPTETGGNAGEVVLSPEQRQSAGIVVEPLRATALRRIIRATGEVRANEYTAGIVSSRATATVISRHAKLGDRVAKGQILVTLYSQDVASAQSDLLLAGRNLARMRRLQNIVARQLVDEALVKEQEARGRLQSLGMTAGDIAALGNRGLSGSQLGQFTLTAPQPGTVIEDNFRVGDVVDAGKTLIQIANLGNLWVEAAVSPTLSSWIGSTDATVVSGERSFPARLLQTHDTVDEQTRTVGVRLEIGNTGGALRPGEFVDVELYGAAAPVLNVPTEAVLRETGGRWIVFAASGEGRFRALPVTVLYASGDRTAIAGITAGTPIVVKGAFFVLSEGSKSSFGEED